MSKMTKIGNLFPDENVPPPDERRIKQTIAIGQSYIEKNTPIKTPILNLFCEQLKYISPLLWATQFFVLLTILLFSFSTTPNLFAVQSILFQISPLAALLAVPELTKDILYNMSELERSCKNSGNTILLMRLTAVVGTNVIMLLFISFVLAASLDCSIFSLILYALVPYNCVNMISLGIMRLLKIKGRNSALAMSLLSAALVFALPTTVAVAEISAFVMVAAFIGTTIVLAAQILELFKSATGGFVAWN